MFFDTSPRKFALIAAVAAPLAALAALYVYLESATPTVDRSIETFERGLSEAEYSVRFGLPGLLFGGSAARAEPPGNAASVPVLLYHGEGDSATTMPTGVFVEQMRALKENGWRTVTVPEFEAFMRGERTLPDKSFLLTFDDGRTDSFYSADPVLKDFGYTAVMFVITGFSLPESNRHATNNFYLNKDELAYMAASGRWELQSHGAMDHRVYDVVDPATGAFKMGQHFLSNKFVAQPGQLETDAEFAARVRGDLSVSKQAIERDFGKPVTAFAYPFNDFGEDTLNFPGARAVLERIVPSLYNLAFYQTWAGNGDSFNYPGGWFVKRIEPAISWSGAELLAVLDAGRAKTLPYKADNFNAGWQENWGDVGEGAALSLSAPKTTTGAAAFLDGTEGWRDYRLSATAVAPVGTVSLVARRRSADEPFAVCAFAEDKIYLEQHSGERQDTLAVARYAPPPPGARLSLSMSIVGSRASCSAYGVVVGADASGIPLQGGVGAEVWDPEAGTARAAIEALSVSPL